MTEWFKHKTGIYWKDTSYFWNPKRRQNSLAFGEREPDSLQTSAAGASWEPCLCDLASTSPGSVLSSESQVTMFIPDPASLGQSFRVTQYRFGCWDLLLCWYFPEKRTLLGVAVPFMSFLFFCFFGTDGYILCIVQYVLEPVLHPVVFNFPLLNPYIVLPPQPLPSSLFSISVRLLHFSSVAHSCPAICDPVDCSTPGLPVHRQLPEFTQTHVH